jgi:hypothetical protein
MGLCAKTQNLTTDSTDNNDLHGSKKFNRIFLNLQIRAIRVHPVDEICFFVQQQAGAPVRDGGRGGSMSAWDT